MTFLIDGYNLLYAIGWAPLPGARLEPARNRLLDWLAEKPRVHSGSAQVCVVFDAQAGPPGASEVLHRGLLVRFAVGRTADDLIEEMLRAEPSHVTVVSNDGRLHESARRAGARAWTCPLFLDWLDEAVSPKDEPDPHPYEKPAGPTPADEVAELLQAFQKPKSRDRQR